MKQLALLLSAALALAPIAGCGEASTPDTGRISILLTDEAGEVTAAVVTIARIYLQPDEGDGESSAERVILRDEAVTRDLLTLAGSTADLVTDAVIPAGRYAQLRFVITGGYIAVEQEDGSTKVYASSPDYEGLPEETEVDGTLMMPSFAQTGIKVILPGDDGVVIDDEATVLLVDFDVSQSYGRQAGLSGMWVMHPVVTASEFSSTLAAESAARE